MAFFIRSIEDDESTEAEYDAAVGKAAYMRYLKNPKTHSHDEVLRMFDDEE